MHQDWYLSACPDRDTNSIFSRHLSHFSDLAGQPSAGAVPLQGNHLEEKLAGRYCRLSKGGISTPSTTATGKTMELEKKNLLKMFIFISNHLP